MGKFFAEKGVDYGQTGWVTETGEFLPCECFQHDELAESRTGKPLSEVEKLWVRVGLLYGKNIIQFEGKRLTKPQIKSLDDWGLVGWVERGRCQLSENFIQCYFAD